MKMSPKDNIIYTLMELDVPMVKEYKFLPNRRFKFDFALIHHKIAIEYEGLVSEKSRHTTITGYTRDTEKYNLALLNGWRVLRYTALNYQNLRSDVLKLLAKDKL